MKVEKFDKSAVKKILTGMIVDEVVVGRVSSHWPKEQGLFEDEWPNLVGSWCIKFYKKYGKAPGKHIQESFASWASSQQSQATVSLIEKFLKRLSGEYSRHKKESNSSYLVDLAIAHFNQVRIERHIEALQGDIDDGKVDKAFKACTTFGKLEPGLQVGAFVLKDHEGVKAAFKDRNKPLIRHHGAMANFFEDTFTRDSFVGFMGPEKRGKTWWLIDTAWRAMLQQRRVAFFEVGDMSKDQIYRRLMIRAARRPFKARSVVIPTSIEHPDGDDKSQKAAHCETKTKKYKTRMSRKEGWQAFCKVAQKVEDDEYLWLGCWPSATLSMSGVVAELKDLERNHDWIPDVVIIDYADILAPPPGYAADSQDQIDANWKAMRSLSQQLHCCVVTATQSDAASVYADRLDRSHFSRDKRKFAHVTAMIGLNQNIEEKEAGVYRLNHLVLRESEYDERKCVHCAGSLALANPCLVSTF